MMVLYCSVLRVVHNGSVVVYASAFCGIPASENIGTHGSCRHFPSLTGLCLLSLPEN